MSAPNPSSRDQARARGTSSDLSASSPSSSSSSTTSRAGRQERESKLDSATGGARGTSLYSRKDKPSRGATTASDDTIHKDYKKMYEQALRTNEKLKSRLEDSKEELARIQAYLGKVKQKQGKMTDRSNVMETERKEKLVLEKRISEMEEELKVRTELKNENQKLKDENGALIRVISKLSK